MLHLPFYFEFHSKERSSNEVIVEVAATLGCRDDISRQFNATVKRKPIRIRSTSENPRAGCRAWFYGRGGGLGRAQAALQTPHALCPAFHLRLTGEARTHHYSPEEAAKGNTHVTNELIGNTYLPH